MEITNKERMLILKDRIADLEQFIKSGPRERGFDLKRKLERIDGALDEIKEKLIAKNPLP